MNDLVVIVVLLLAAAVVVPLVALQVALYRFINAKRVLALMTLVQLSLLIKAQQDLEKAAADLERTVAAPRPSGQVH